MVIVLVFSTYFLLCFIAYSAPSDAEMAIADALYNDEGDDLC